MKRREVVHVDSCMLFKTFFVVFDSYLLVKDDYLFICSLWKRLTFSMFLGLLMFQML